jgi:hypothetical protein
MLFFIPCAPLEIRKIEKIRLMAMSNAVVRNSIVPA